MQTPATDLTEGSKKHRILVVEDDLETRTFLELALDDTYEVLTAESASEALTHVQRQRIDLMLVDIALRDEVDGLALVADLRRNEALEKTPMVAMTAHSMRAERQFYLDRGFDDFIGKPFYPQDLLDLIAGYLRDR